MIEYLNDNKELDKNLVSLLEKVFQNCMIVTNQTYDKLTCSLDFVSKEYIHSLNESMRNVDKPTDVLSFPLLNLKAGDIVNPDLYPFDIDMQTGELSLGDIVICDDIAKEQALEYGHSQEREYAYLFLHGLLHLLGYDHMQDEEKKVMREIEENVLDRVEEIKEKY